MSSQQYQAAHRFGRHAYIVAAFSFTVLSLVCLIVVSVSGLGVTRWNLVDSLSRYHALVGLQSDV
jgi:heme exporter protein D